LPRVNVPEAQVAVQRAAEDAPIGVVELQACHSPLRRHGSETKQNKTRKTRQKKKEKKSPLNHPLPPHLQNGVGNHNLRKLT
jgi:hypothetical protein